LSEYRPDVVLVHADTATTLSATAVAYGQQIPVAHLQVEPKSRKSTFLPGMSNRRISGVPLHMSVPSDREPAGDEERTALSDRSTLSALLRAVTRIRQETDLRHELRGRLGLKYSRTPLVLVAHRESDDFEHVARAVRKVKSKLPDISIAYSIHLPIGPDSEVSPPGWKVMNGHVVERLDCLTFGWLLDAAHVVLTDSSDIQEAADRLGKPTLTLQGVTARPNAASDGSGANQSDIHELAIAEGVMTLLSDTQAYEAMCRARRCSCDSEDCLRVIEALASVPLETPPIAA
jgi:UDP-N-acetylglucosamine 2-epimerase